MPSARSAARADSINLRNGGWRRNRHLSAAPVRARTTLLNLAGVVWITPTEGEGRLAGSRFVGAQGIRARAVYAISGLGFVYQFHHLLAEFTALENVCMRCLIRRTLDHQGHVRWRVLRCLRPCRAERRAGHKPSRELFLAVSVAGFAIARSSDPISRLCAAG